MVSGSLPLSPGKAKVKRMLEGKEREEDLETIEALPLGSDAEMKREFVEIGGLAADAKNPEWVLRVKALQRFRRLVAGGCHELGMFMAHMKEYMKEPLIQAVQDLRSAVSKEACHAVTHLCRTLPPEKWEVMSDWFLPALFKISVVTIAVISQSSSRCLRYILRKGRVSHRAVFVALEPQNFENKHATYRQTVYQTIFSLLHKMPSDTFLARELDLVVRALRQGLADPMPEVRRISRLLYWAAYYMIPDRVEEIFDALDAAGQKNVLEEKAVYDGLQDAVGVEWECLPRAPPASPKVGTGGGGGSGLPSAATAPDLRHADSTLPHTPSKADTAARLVRPGGRGGGGAPHGNKDRSTTPLPRRATSGAVTPAKSGRRTPSKPAAAAATTTFDDIDATMESSVFLDDSGVFNTPPPGGNAKRRPGGGPPSAAATRRPKQQAPPPTAASLRTLQFTSIEMGEPSDDDLSSSAASRKDSWAGGGGAGATVEEILAMESKAAACRMLGRLVLEEDVEMHGVRQKVNAIAEYLAGSMEEGRRNTSQVVAAAFRAFGAYAEAFQDTAALEPHFERVFSLIFPRLGAPSTHTEALSLLEKLLECGHTRVLVPVLLRVLNSSSDKVQLGCLEYMLHLIQFSREFLLKPANMETCICKFAHLANSPNYNVKNASVTCLGLLHSTSPQLFCEAVLQMTQGEQRTMKEVLHSTVPTLADQIDGGVYNPPTRAGSAAAASRHADPTTHAPQRSSAANGVSSSADASAASAAAAAVRARKAKKPAAGSVSPAAPPPQQQQLPKSPARRLPSKAGHTSGPAHRSKTPTPQPETAAAATTLAFKKIGSSAPKRPAGGRGGGGGGSGGGGGGAIGPKPLSILTQDVLDTGSLAAARELAGACATAPLSHVREALAELPSLVLQDDLDEEVRVCIIDASVAMIRRLNPTRATPSVRSFFALCLNCYCDPVPKVSEHAQDGLFNLVQTISSVCAMELLTAELTTRGPLSQDEEVPFLFRILESFLTRVGSQNPQELLEMAESGGVAALVHAGINSERADVRKAVVFCFVALYVSLGSACVPLLKPLTTSQLKLITIYVNRKQGKPDQAALAQ